MRRYCKQSTSIFRTMNLILIFSFFANGLVAQPPVNFIKNVQTYQDSVKIATGAFPNVIDSSTFNIDTYFQFFDKLSLPTGSKLHSFYWDERTGGLPILYVQADSFDMENYLEIEFEKYTKEHGLDKSNLDQKLIDYRKYEFRLANALENRACKYVLPEDNEAGYLQFLFFNRFGEEFALKWHANSGQKSVIHSKDEFKRLYNFYLRTDDFSCDMKKFEALLALDPSPQVEMDKSSCSITWYEIATHQGIYKRSYMLSRSVPYSIEKREDIEILTIETNFIY